MRVEARAPRRPLPPAAPVAAAVAREGQLPRLLIAFVLAQMALQLLLVLVDLGPLRTLARVAAFGLSLAYLVVVKGPERRHPARGVAIAVCVLLALSIFHPETDGLVAGAAQTGLYLAILAPLFWTARMRIDGGGLRTLVFLFWAFHAVSSVFGVLQVQFPGRFQPTVSAVLQARGDEYLEAMSFEAASGEQVLRPMGLTDTPGGAATSGLYTVLLGTGLLLSERRFWRRALYLSTMVLGMACIYMSQVRVALVMLAISLLAVGAFFVLRGMVRRIAAFLGALALVAGVGLSLALSLGGSAVSSRLETLTAANPGEVYQSNRGHFLEYTITELVPEYPLGAGLARWGMINTYFGAGKVEPIWAEIQITGWVLDGGVPLVLLWMLALFLTLRAVARVGLGRGPQFDALWLWAAVLFGYGIGTVALTFSYPVFVSQAGLEFWLLTGALLAARPLPSAQRRPLAPSPLRAPRGAPRISWR